MLQQQSASVTLVMTQEYPAHALSMTHQEVPFGQFQFGKAASSQPSSRTPFVCQYR